MSTKLGFWSVLAIVIGSQIGSGMFMLPASFAPYGLSGLVGWLLAAIGALSLGVVFAILCQMLPKTGGPHVYVERGLGRTAAFFAGWTYWVVSWVSTAAVLVTCAGYLSPFLGAHSQAFYVWVEIVILAIFTALNLRGLHAAGNAEFILSALKCILLLIIPICAIKYFNINNFILDASVASLPLNARLTQVTVLALWGFIGLECATAPAGSVHNASVTIPRAIILGTLIVAVIYILNYVGVAGMVPGNVLMQSSAPYDDVTRLLFGGNWHLWVSFAAVIILIGSLNAWILTSGQIVYGLAQDRLMSSYFGITNRHGAPSVGIVISSLGIVPFLVLTAQSNFAQQITAIIEMSVLAFLFVYFICVISLIIIFIKNNERRIHYWLATLIAFVFCSMVVIETPLKTLLTAAAFVVCGVPVYFWRKRWI